MRTAADNEQHVKDALKKYIGEFDRMLASADDPDELIERLAVLTDATKGSRRDMRDRKPIAQLSSGSPVSSPASQPSNLPQDELDIVESLKGKFNGGLQDVLTFVNESAQKLQEAQESNNTLTGNLRTAQAEVQRLRSTPPPPSMATRCVSKTRSVSSSRNSPWLTPRLTT
jgi:hypothetical protein